MSQHSKEEIDEIVNKRKVPSYNLIKGLGYSNCGNFFSYQIFVDNDCNIDSLLYLTSLAFLLFSFIMLCNKYKCP